MTMDRSDEYQPLQEGGAPLDEEAIRGRRARQGEFLFKNKVNQFHSADSFSRHFQLRQAIEEEEEVQRQRVQRDRMRGREIREFNETNKYVKEETLKVKKEQDQMLLDYALRKEREANEAEEAKRLATRRAAIQYRKYLEEQMIKEAEDTAFMDEVCKREEERVWKMRDDALQARDDARRALMQQVDEGRQEQIRLKREAIEQEKEEGLRFANKCVSGLVLMFDMLQRLIVGPFSFLLWCCRVAGSRVRSDFHWKKKKSQHSNGKKSAGRIRSD